MGFLPPTLLAVVAVLLFILAVVGNSEILAMASFAVGGVALGTLISTIRHLLREARPDAEVERRLREMEERLRLTEERLGMTEDELERVRIAAEFDVELRGPRRSGPVRRSRLLGREGPGVGGADGPRGRKGPPPRQGTPRRARVGRSGRRLRGSRCPLGIPIRRDLALPGSGRGRVTRSSREGNAGQPGEGSEDGLTRRPRVSADGVIW